MHPKLKSVTHFKDGKLMFVNWVVVMPRKVLFQLEAMIVTIAFLTLDKIITSLKPSLVRGTDTCKSPKRKKRKEK